MAIQTSSTPITPSASVTAAAVTLTTLLSSQPPKPASAIPPLLDQRRSQRQNGQHKNGAGAKRRIDSVSATPAKSKKATQQPKYGFHFCDWLFRFVMTLCEHVCYKTYHQIKQTSHSRICGICELGIGGMCRCCCGES